MSSTGSYGETITNIFVTAVSPLNLVVNEIFVYEPPPPPSDIINPITIRPSNINRISINTFNVNAPRVVIRSN